MPQDQNYNPFDRIRVEVPQTNTFSLSRDNKLSLDIGKLYPVMVEEMFPGDFMSITPEMLLRMAPMTFPIMHKIDAFIHFFYVPNRILWSKWERYIAGETIVPPYLMGAAAPNDFKVDVGSLHDYMGLPLTDNMTEKILAFPYLAYWRIVNEYYQDQNNDGDYATVRSDLENISNLTGLIPPASFFGATKYEDIPLASRAWEHDYFTAALPFAQKGSAVSIPIQLADLPVTVAKAETFVGADAPIGDVITATFGSDTALAVGTDGVQLTGTAFASGASLAGTINELRVATQLQMFLEANARGGTRYNEQIKIHWGENIGDDRISRPEYLGGIRNNVVISEVLQTSTESGTEPLGSYAGHGTAVVGGNTINCKSTEHGYIIGILSVRPKTAYFQGIPRKFSRQTYLDFPWPQFSHLGEQAILKKEVYFPPTGPDGDENETFGYIPRYSELKYAPSEVHGDFRTTMLDFHLARNFATRPVLNDEFIYVNDDKRIFAVTTPTVQSLYAHIWFNITAKRKFPFYTDPSALG